MRDEERIKRIMFLLKLWFYLTDSNLVWPKVKEFVEQQINEELGEHG